MAVAQLQQDLQAMRSLQTVLVRELAETRDSLKASDQRTANLNREIADLRTQVVSATDEIRLLHDRIPPAAPSDLSPGTSVVTAPTGLSDTPPPAQQRSTIRESGPTVLSEEIVARLDGSVFHSGSAELQPEGRFQAGRRSAVHGFPSKGSVRIVGHTDASGNDERNLVLSVPAAPKP